MTKIELAGKIDLTLLTPVATERDIERLITEAFRYPFASVCVPPCHVGFAAGLIKGTPLGITTVVGFPLGFLSADVKVFEAAAALRDGASEIDMVMNISIFKSGRAPAVEDEIRRVVTEASGATVKVIIEACYLTDAEKEAATELSISAGASFVKTSTGFGPGGATEDDVRLLGSVARGRIKVKASGGIRTTEDALKMLSAGADRLGASSGVAIVEGLKF